MSIHKKLKNPTFPLCDHCRRIESNYKTVEPIRSSLPKPFDQFRSKVLFPQIEICLDCLTNPAYTVNYWKQWLEKIESGFFISKAYDVYCHVYGPEGESLGTRTITAVAYSHDRAGTAAGNVARATWGKGTSIAIVKVERSSGL